ncbi:hypothetical protein AX16_007378 [Volvariella volvacea WC 439]|nr:hypothetical protein AX16_007378 [Volvariella volvacea WC 439]
MQLPVEITYEVINALSTSECQYGYNDETLRKLLSLCLCSCAVSQYTIPILYRSIRIVNKRQVVHLHDLFTSKPHLANHVESIYLGGADVSGDRWVESLEQLAGLITLLQLTVRHLFIDRKIENRPLDNSYRSELAKKLALLSQAIYNCQLLEEFCNIRYDSGLWEWQGPSTRRWIPSWKAPKRLVLFNVQVSVRSVEVLVQQTSIETVVSYVPFHEWLSDVPVPPTSKRGKLKRVPEEEMGWQMARWYGYSRVEERGVMLEEWERGKGGSFEMVEVVADSWVMGDWIRDRIWDGSIWSISESFEVPRVPVGSTRGTRGQMGGEGVGEERESFSGAGSGALSA